MTYKTEGIIIRKRDLTEADRLITVYTKDFGKILLKAKAVKKNQAKLKGHLELFLHSHLMFAQGRGLDIAIGAETIDSFSVVHNHLPCSAGAYCVSELIDKLVVGPESDENVWQLVLSVFQKLNQSDQNIDLLIKDFSARLLEFLGYGEFENQDPFFFINSQLGNSINSIAFLQDVNYLIK